MSAIALAPRRAWAWLRGLVEWESDERSVTIGSPGSLAMLTVAAMSLGYAYVVVGGVTSSGGGQSGGSIAGTPGTPTITASNPDTSTFIVTFTTAFQPNGGDTQDSISVTVLRSGAADTLFHAKSGVQSADTVSDNADLKADTTYRILGRQKGTDGGWSVADTISIINGTFTFPGLNLPVNMTLDEELAYDDAGDLLTPGPNSTADFDGSAISPPESPPEVVRFVYPEGIEDGGVGNNRTDVVSNAVKVYIAVNFYYSDPFQFHISNTKFLYFYKTGGGGSLVVGFKPITSDRDGEFQVTWDPQVSGSGDSGNSGDVGLARGQWHYMEVLAVMNTATSEDDGILKIWLDGTLIKSSTTMTYGTSGTLTWFKWNLDPYFGGSAFDPTDQVQYLYVDHSISYSSATR